jgi:regulator of protease activity HflC (stomatin/prohibitin superfamily)
MSTIAWIILLIFLIPALALLAWVILGESFIRVPAGKLGLLMVRGRPTDTTLVPGVHFIFALRRRMVVMYPAVEMTYRAGGVPEAADQPELDRTGPGVTLFLGDRTSATVSYTVRFRLIPDQLRQIHERYGPGGIFGAVRDKSTQVLTTDLGNKEITVDDVFGAARDACQESVGADIAEVLKADGIDVTAFLLGTVELGRTGEVIQAISRARHELEQEHAAAETRLARATNDLQLGAHTGSAGEAGWRYRETDLWRDLVERTQNLNIALQALNRGPIEPGSGAASTTPPSPSTNEQQR